MKILLVILLWFTMLPANAATPKQGEYLGAKTSEMPYWFKDSFLEFEEDVAEAASENKRLLIYFHQEGCPYCAKLVEENFADPEIESYVRQHFEGIQVNMWGDREIVAVGGNNFTEKTFASALKVQYTPTVLFLNEQGKVALRLNGYYPPEKFRLALRYVAEKQESKQSYNEFVRENTQPVKGPLVRPDFFLTSSSLQTVLNDGNKYLAVYFEAPECKECELMHSRVLSDKPTRKLAMEMNNIQLNIYSDDKITTLDGSKISQSEYAKQLNISYVPSVVFYNPQGEEVHRIEGFLKTFHFQSSLAYVLEKGYLTQPSFQRYISQRGEKLREMGYDTDIWGYNSSHPAELGE